ncbi:hypothetical protein VPNG_02161 [Cytospora leucostoma]|uniref:FAD dependent oxidoreductase domain-containing protein n=1 Tax=Cytospora leucostoma TaxID=1230097 RepID=A0A423XHF0_9PEZI|nr:hypothetical protein VPNG_02161 [Cytospora leucostoma]
MAPRKPDKDGKIVIIGASPFGLSTALHLAARGYKDITIFDKRSQSDLTDLSKQTIPYAAIHYRSADKTLHRNLSVEAFTAWNAWNKELWGGETVPPGLSPEDRLFINNGYFYLFEGDAIPDADVARVRALEQKGLGGVQLLTTDLGHVSSANSRMFHIDPFRREERDKADSGVLDSLGGTVLIENVYRFVIHKARTLGIKFILGPPEGAVEKIEHTGRGTDGVRDVKGLRTRDGKTHDLDNAVWASEDSIPNITSPLDTTATRSIETTAVVRIPTDGELWEQFSPDNFPSWEHKLRNEQGAVLFGFPRDEAGHLIIGIRATAGPNIAREDAATDRIKIFIAEFLPELKVAGLGLEKLSTSSPGKAYPRTIDRVPGVNNLLLVADASIPGEEFLLLPSIGGHVVDVLEGGAPAVEAWGWKSGSSGKPTTKPEPGGLPKAKL